LMIMPGRSWVAGMAIAEMLSLFLSLGLQTLAFCLRT
jgi:hypothetical protein